MIISSILGGYTLEHGKILPIVGSASSSFEKKCLIVFLKINSGLGHPAKLGIATLGIATWIKKKVWTIA